jgi:polyphosphate kinase 2 (PPK2 family)
MTDMELRDIGARRVREVTVRADDAAPKTKSSKPDLTPPLPKREKTRTQGAELPAVGRPRAQTIDSLWKEIESSFAGQSITLEEAIGKLGDLGFSLKKAHGDEAKLTRGDFEVRLEKKHLGSHGALDVEMKGPKSAERSGVHIEGTMLPDALYKEMKKSYKETLDDFEDALAAHGHAKLPTEFEALKGFIEAGASKKDQAKEAAQEAEISAALDGILSKLELMKSQGLAPRGIVVYVDGPDGAGKSSTAAIVLRAIEAAGYDSSTVTFKAPTEEERKQHWLQRFRDRGVPEGAGKAIFWDRGPAGDTVYAPRTQAEVKKMAEEEKKMERELAKDDVFLFKLHLFATPEKQAATFGKRLARQRAAERISHELEKHGKLDPNAQAALDEVRHKIDGDDFKALVTFDGVQSKFLRFSKLTGTRVIDATKRHPARLDIIEAFGADLDAFAAAKAKRLAA